MHDALKLKELQACQILEKSDRLKGRNNLARQQNGLAFCRVGKRADKQVTPSTKDLRPIGWSS